jgi:pyruvate/2-oxoglutarate dehydrogenase complex dihydrolipoamide acyltransferase (E2) component
MRQDVRLPALYEGMSEQDTATIVHWYVQEQDVVKPDGLLLRVETTPSLTDIPQPLSQACRVLKLHKHAGDTLHIGDLLVTLETLDTSTTNEAL